MIIKKRITIIKINKPSRQSLNQELQWLCRSLGLFGERDRDKSCFRLFLELLKSSKEHKSLSSDELASRTALSRGTVVHHLNELIRKGLVIPSGKKYILRADDLHRLIEDVEKDFERMFKELKKSAEVIDKILE